jgi:hypothetical protein
MGLNQEVEQPLDAVRAKPSHYLPTVLTKAEVRAVLQQINSQNSHLLAQFGHWAAHFSKSRTHFSVFRRQKGYLPTHFAHLPTHFSR